MISDANEIREVIAGILTSIFGPSSAGAPSDPLAAGRLDSVAMVRLLTELEERFQVQLPPESIVPENFKSLDALTGLVQRLHRP